ncbi:hypothetical protein [Nocardia thailandica]
MDQVIAACADLSRNYTRLGTVTGDSAAELKNAAQLEFPAVTERLKAEEPIYARPRDPVCQEPTVRSPTR